MIHINNNWIKKHYKYVVIIVLLIISFLGGWYLHTPETDKYSLSLGTSSINHKEITKEDVINAHNAERAKAGLKPLVLNDKLALAAQNKAQDMKERNYFSHNNPIGKTPWDFILATGYNYKWAGENLSRDWEDYNDLVNAWMNSEGHRKNILNPNFKEMGVGINDKYISVMFGSPK